ncbi:MAG TPA: DUF2459 domain-containing protein, partial [Candidatus Sulfotelmatobacter sp.]|nr:DUF2459 domain-containing protein [Candidatus Sulfotelmatobacter sp.]
MVRTRVLFRFLCLAAIGLHGGCAAPPERPAPDGPRDKTVFVIDRGWHTDIGLPVGRLPEPLAALARAAPGTRFLVFGFGDRAYYMARAVTVGQSLAALFPGPGVVLVTSLGATPEAAFGAANVVALHLSSVAYADALDFIRGTLRSSSGQPPLRLGDGPYPGSAFYASGRTYDAIDNCNGWTARTLAR